MSGNILLINIKCKLRKLFLTTHQISVKFLRKKFNSITNNTEYKFIKMSEDQA